MSNRDAEFAEFLAATWPRVYRTTYAVAGQHALTREAMQKAFAQVYAGWGRALDSEAGPEAEVRNAAIEIVINAYRSTSVAGASTKFGPLVTHGRLISASEDERAQVDALWAELQELEPAERAVIAQSAAAATDANYLTHDGLASGPQRLVEFLAASLPEVMIGGADLDSVIKQGSARKRRVRWITVAATIVVFALVAIPTVLFAPQEKAVSGRNIGVWREVASAPLTPRWAALATWTGNEALFIGGFSQESCAPRSGCRGLRDGAAYDPKNDTWRPIARAPFSLESDSAYAQFGDQLFVAGPRWVKYDASDDEWTDLPPSPEPYAGGDLAVLGGSIYSVGPGESDRIHAFNGSTDRWSTLPAIPPTSPLLRHRNLVGTPEGLVVVGADAADPPGDPLAPQELLAQVFDGRTWRQLVTESQRGLPWRWSWAGERLIHPERVPVYGGDNKRDGVRFAGGLTLDPDTGIWGYLPEAPADARGVESWRLYAEGGPVIAADGYVYDDRDTSWTRLNRPVQAPAAAVASVWADERLLAFGGANFGGGEDENSGSTNRLWIYTPRVPDAQNP